MQISYFTENIGTKAGQIPVRNLSIDELVILLQSDKLANLISKIRATASKKEANLLKKQLPYVTPSGTFSPSRLLENLVQHSGLISLDFDNVENLEETRIQLQSDEYVRLCFLSPRGNGLKVLVEIAPCDAEKHKNYFYDLSQYFQQTYACSPTADISCSDITRACFLSHDTNVYHNPNSKEYKIKGYAAPEKLKKLKERAPIAPTTDTEAHIKAIVERIENARIDLTQNYNDWVLIGFSMACLGEVGRDFYHRVSAISEKYDAHECDKKFDNYLKTTRFQIPNKFFTIAKEHQVDISKPKDDTIPLPYKKVGQPPNIEPTNKKEKEQKQEEEIKEERKIYNVKYSNGGISIFGNKNWVRVADNFQVFVKYCTENENEELTWILELQRIEQTPLYLEVSHEEFCSAKKLKDAIAAKRLSLKITDTYLGELHAYLFNTEFATAEKVSRFGWHIDSKVFFFANKAVVGPKLLATPDEFGIVKAGEKYLSMPVINKKKLNRFTLTESDMTFNRWFGMLAAAHKRENAFLPVCFYLMSVFRDIVIEHTKASPILYLKGGASTGKSSIIRSISNLFGFEQQGVNLKNKNTEAALVRLMSQASNTVIWFDEYHNEFPYEGLLQAAYDNDGYHRASDTTSHATDSVDIYSALALTSNYLPDNPIFFSRCVFIPIMEQKKTPQQIDAFNALRDAEKVGFGAVTVEILAYRTYLEEHFQQDYDSLYNELKKALVGETVVERLISNMARIMTPAYILQRLGLINLEMDVVDMEDVRAEFVEIGTNNIRRQNHIQSEKTALSEFFEILQYAFEQNMVYEQIHFRIEGNFLLLRFPSIYPIYQQKFRQINYKPGADRDTLRQEILTFEQGREDSEVIKGIRFAPEDLDDTSRATKVVSNSWCVSYDRIAEKFGVDLSLKRDVEKYR